MTSMVHNTFSFLVRTRVVMFTKLNPKPVWQLLERTPRKSSEMMGRFIYDQTNTFTKSIHTDIKIISFSIASGITRPAVFALNSRLIYLFPVHILCSNQYISDLIFDVFLFGFIVFIS